MNFHTYPTNALMEITSRPPNVFVKGEGSYLWDNTGKRHLDFVQGWAVNCLGHSPIVVADAITRQARQLITPSPALLQRCCHSTGGEAGNARRPRSGVFRQFWR
jgi:acetylornithine/N-succinyldiaminopimelate aminotransferase